MSNIEKLREDVAYVRAAAVRSDVVPCRSIYLLWAAIALCGFTMRDFAPEPSWINLYWLIAAPGGIVLSVWLGKRASMNIGQADRQDGFSNLVPLAGILSRGTARSASGRRGAFKWSRLWFALGAIARPDLLSRRSALRSPAFASRHHCRTLLLRHHLRAGIRMDLLGCRPRWGTYGTGVSGTRQTRCRQLILTCPRLRNWKHWLVSSNTGCASPSVFCSRSTKRCPSAG